MSDNSTPPPATHSVPRWFWPWVGGAAFIAMGFTAVDVRAQGAPAIDGARAAEIAREMRKEREKQADSLGVSVEDLDGWPTRWRSLKFPPRVEPLKSTCKFNTDKNSTTFSASVDVDGPNGSSDSLTFTFAVDVPGLVLAPVEPPISVTVSVSRSKKVVRDLLFSSNGDWIKPRLLPLDNSVSKSEVKTASYLLRTEDLLALATGKALIGRASAHKFDLIPPDDGLVMLRDFAASLNPSGAPESTPTPPASPDLKRMDVPALRVRLNQLNRERETLVKDIEVSDARLQELTDRLNATAGEDYNSDPTGEKRNDHELSRVLRDAEREKHSALQERLTAVETELDTVTELIERAK